MDADFDRYYRRDLAEVIWLHEWPASKISGRILALPEDSAYARSINEGHTSLHEVLAQVRDAVVTTAHGWRIEGKPQPYPRPQVADAPSEGEALDLTDPEDAAKISRFFRTHR